VTPVPEPDGPKAPPPKLTLGQRLLAALPDLQRAAPRPSSGPSSASAPAGGAAGASADDDVIQPDAVISAGGRTVGSSRRSSPAARAAGPRVDPYAAMSVAELRLAMKGLDPTERRYPLAVGPLIAVLDLVLTVVALHTNPALHHKGHTNPTDIVALGIGSAVIAGLVVVAAMFRRRSLTIFALLFSGYGGGVVTLIPAWVLAGFLFIRFNRMQKSLTAKTGGPAAARADAAERRAARLEQRRQGGRRAKAPAAPAGPPPNKRYTPPKPVRPKPPAPD